MATDQNNRNFFATAKDKANELLAQPHIGADVKTLIKDLTLSAENFRDFSEQASGLGADVRVMKRRLEAMRGNNKAAAAKMQDLRKTILSIAMELEVINIEATKIAKRYTPEVPDGACAARIQEAAKKVVAVVSQLASNLPAFPDE